MKRTISVSLLAAVSVSCVESQEVNFDNYVQAETEWYFSTLQAEQPVNEFKHNGIVSKEEQDVIRSNRDAVYSIAIVDVSSGATLSIPERDDFQMIQYMDENHLTHGVIYAGETATITPEDLTSGNYIYILARTRITDDLEETFAAQKAMTIEANSAIPYAGNAFDDAETIAFREKLANDLMTGNTERQLAAEKAFGATLDDVDFFDYVYGAAVGWGGLPATHAQYAPVIPGQGGTECSVVTFDVPNLDFDSDGFFSITTYSFEGWVDSDRFYIGHRDMQDNGDGTVTVHFNCPDVENSLEVTESWTGVLRLFKPVDVDETINYVQNFLGTANVEAVR